LKKESSKKKGITPKMVAWVIRGYTLHPKWFRGCIESLRFIPNKKFISTYVLELIVNYVIVGISTLDILLCVEKIPNSCEEPMAF